ncbi:phosphatidylglycerophosphatase A family protein [Thetidibacter halocola]|uniref:Phosphatidylglycerophosphatase A n=1 Tax=Thetidibacter halocola TaxID=2827239 RepID=A0A8J8B6X8_9RHOB|nr:phosphatidylglycerophosphatase A [Thetidibacter halocola]MBS0123000.1 phosphatidylglycerophosphatase A [Thetidibacter halocola]
MKWVASLGGVGFLRPGPGTWGSALAVVLAYGLASVADVWLFLNLTVFAFVTGWIATQKLIAGKDDHDPSWIVIDELVGQWIALLPVVYGVGMMGVEPWKLYPGWIAAFVLFRLFDIWKPWLVGRADRMGGALGVMLDDVVAGVFAALGTIALAALFHLVLM